MTTILPSLNFYFNSNFKVKYILKKNRYHMLTVKLEYEVVSMFSPIQLTWINEYEPHRFKTLDFIHCNEIIIDDLFKLYS